MKLSSLFYLFLLKVAFIALIILLARKSGIFFL